MTTQQAENDKQKSTNEDAAIKPDPETLNSTDPQEHMEGPLSSLMQKTGDDIESKGSEGEEENETDE